MTNFSTLYDEILDIANCTSIKSDTQYIASQIIKHSHQLNEMTQQDFLDYACINSNQLKKFCKQIGLKGYTDLKNKITFWLQVRKKQIEERYTSFDINKNAQALFNMTQYEDIDDFYNSNLIDRICETIYGSDKVVVYGSRVLSTLMHDFQIDMKLFGKDIVLSSLHEHTLTVPNKKDLVWEISLTGRSLELPPMQFRNSIHHKKVSVSLNQSSKDSDFSILLKTPVDSFESHYIYMFYLDVIKYHYYEKYIKGK